jgi:hypothetical protein
MESAELRQRLPEPSITMRRKRGGDGKWRNVRGAHGVSRPSGERYSCSCSPCSSIVTSPSSTVVSCVCAW